MGLSSVTFKSDESFHYFLFGWSLCVCVCVHVYNTACSSDNLRSFDFSNAYLEGIKRGA